MKTLVTDTLHPGITHLQGKTIDNICRSFLNPSIAGRDVALSEEDLSEEEEAKPTEVPRPCHQIRRHRRRRTGRYRKYGGNRQCDAGLLRSRVRPSSRLFIYSGEILRPVDGFQIRPSQVHRSSDLPASRTDENGEDEPVHEEEAAGRHPGLLVGDACCTFCGEEDVFDAAALLRAAEAAKTKRKAMAVNHPKVKIKNVKYAPAGNISKIDHKNNVK